MRKTIRRGFLLACVPLALLELLVRAGVLAPAPLFPAFQDAAQVARHRPISYVFVGSSRVAAAVRAETFSRLLADGAVESTTVNLGRGYSTLAEDYLALERLYEAEGDRASGATVLIEAPEGLPMYSTFHDSWVHPDMPELIVPVLTPRAVARLWTESATPFADKVQVTARYVLRSVDYVAQLRARIISSGPQFARRLAAGILHRRADPDIETAGVDLDPVGGIVATRDGITRARRLALLEGTLREVTAAEQDDRPVNDWSSTIVLQLNQLVKAHRGTLVAYEMPLSSILKRGYQTPVRRADAKRFRSAALAAGITFLSPSFAATDDDFPDYWHLRASRAGAFTESLAAAYLGVRRRARAQAGAVPRMTFASPHHSA